VGLAYYVRAAGTLYAPSPVAEPRPAAVAWPVAGVLATATAVAVVVGFAPQLILDAAAR
jgi:NADH-quinone oxidoreductase subunit N